MNVRRDTSKATAASVAARRSRAEHRLAEHLAEAGWAVLPPGDRPIPSRSVRQAVDILTVLGWQCQPPNPKG